VIHDAGDKMVVERVVRAVGGQHVAVWSAIAIFERLEYDLPQGPGQYQRSDGVDVMDSVWWDVDEVEVVIASSVGGLTPGRNVAPQICGADRLALSS
jgi:hypothetical protein